MTYAALGLALALAAAVPPPDELAESDDALLRRYPVTIDARAIHVPRCTDVDAFESEFAFASVEVTAHVPFPGVDRQGRYFGRTRFTVRHVTLHLPATISWPGMSEDDRAAAAAAVAALRHHEVGHLRVAAAEVARLNALPLTVTPDAEAYRRTEIHRQDSGLAALAKAQADYDALTGHGRRQPRASGVLGGPPTELRCEGRA